MPGPKAKARVVAMTFVVAALGLSVFMLPTMAQWRIFTSEDTGSGLSTVVLTEHGDRPGLDNGYLYGLLPLAVSRLWYGVLGINAGSPVAAWFLSNALMGWGMARIAVKARVGWAGGALMLAVLPTVGIQSLAHMMEPVLIVHAVAELAGGRKKVALVLATAAAFVKPSMAGVLGLILLFGILKPPVPGDPKLERFVDRARALIPATVFGLVLLVVFDALFGLPALLQSLVPTHAARVYRTNHFGFFGSEGRTFLAPPNVKIGYYLGTQIGFWLVGTLLLSAGALEGFLRPAASGASADEPDPSRNRELVAACAILHLAFIGFFFGNSWSWSTYIYLLSAGLAALAPRSRTHAMVIWVLAAMALLGMKSRVEGTLHDWQTHQRSASAHGLWALPAEQAEWRKVKRLVHGQHPVVLAQADGIAVLEPDFEPPALFMITPGEVTDVEAHRKLDQIAAARYVVESSTRLAVWPTDYWPEFAAPLKGAEKIFDGSFHRVYRKTPSPSPGNLPRPR